MDDNQTERKTFGARIKAYFGGIAPTVPALPSMGSLEGGEPSLTAQEYRSKVDQLKANIGWVYAVNSQIADDTSAVKLRLYQKKPDGELEEIDEHPVLSLIDDPNLAITSRQMWNLHYQYLNLTGESYILKLDQNGKPLLNDKVLPSALLPLPSHMVEFKVGKNWVDSIVKMGEVEYPITAVLRDSTPDPENIYKGLSVVRKASLTVDTDYEMKKWNNRLFHNGARPGVVLSSPVKLKDESRERLKQQFDDGYAGSENSFKRLLLEEGMTIEPFMLNAQDLDFLASKAFTRDEILAMFKVSKTIVGIVEDVNRASAETAEYIYAKRIIKPRLEQFVDFINRRLIAPLDPTLELGFDDPVPEDVDRKLATANAGLNKWLTIDEVRAEYGYEALPNKLGEVLYVPINNVPITDLATIVTTPTDETPPETPPEAPEGDETDETKELPKDLEKRDTLGELKAQKYTRQGLAYEKMILRSAKKMFNAQKADVKQWLADNADKDKGYDHIDLAKKDWASDMVDWAKYGKQFKSDMEKIFGVIVEEVGEQAFRDLVDTGSFDPKTAEILKWVDGEATLVAVGVNKETEKQIRATLAQGIREGEATIELQARVVGVFGTASSQRAYAIAQTESAIAQNSADVSAWKQSGVVEGKEWFTAGDDATCKFCQDMDSRYASLTDNFYDKGERVRVEGNTLKLDYRDIGEPPLHTHCRCVLLPILKEV